MSKCSVCGEKIEKKNIENVFYEKCTFCSYEYNSDIEPMEEEMIKKHMQRAWKEYKNRDNYNSRFRDPLTGAEMKGRSFEKGEESYKFCFVFEHSNEPRDWFTNFFACKKKVHLMGKDVYFHKGYYIAAKRLMSCFPKNENGEMFLSGYSMGAGVAAIFAILYAAENPSCDVVCVAMEGAKYYKGDLDIENLQIVNVENGNDTVTKVPWWLGKYEGTVHIGEERKWHKTGLKFRYDKTEDGLYKFFDVPDHHFDAYEKSLNEFLGEKGGEE